ncbi:hypothetical protein E8E13_000619 [Curvularia kusanoi]|uniref:Uncharacterized protein n=1 Tax=Curvularia kusanoi TaxID=90978 RepID=A0A9P4T9K4_CURKU|nr:hypothetical protein E8E13_000619 [Curvularia kusanoi]
MDEKLDLLIIDSTVSEIDVARRHLLAQRVNILYYDCPTIDDFKKRMKPGGQYANIVAIMRNGWHKAGPLANQYPFAADVLPCFPKSLKLIACSGHGFDAADIEGLTARGIMYCNTPNACTEAVAVTALSLIIDSFRFLSFAQWCARYDWTKSRELGPIAVDPTNKTLGIVGLGDIGLAVAQKYNGPQQDYEAITYRKFKEVCLKRPECGIKPMQIKWHYEVPIEEAGILTSATGKLWFEDLVGGLRKIEKNELPLETVFGFEMASFVIDVQKYLPWLQAEATRLDIEFHRRIFDSIDDAFKRYPGTAAVFNCTGLGAMTLGGVEDNTMYPARGQILLVEGPEKPLDKMYFRAPHRGGEATHIFPRGENGGVILGGCRQKNNWSGETDFAFAEVIKRRCCSLVPELGKPEDLKIIKHGVGLRPARDGGPRVESEMRNGKLVIHNYGAGGVGFQASWGLAQYAADLLPEKTRI